MPAPPFIERWQESAAAEAYGWPADLSDEEILFRLVDLNFTRASEERAGLIRWIRPEFQRTAETQGGLDVGLEEAESQPASAARQLWPTGLPGRVRAIRDYLVQAPGPVPAATVARAFTRARVGDVSAILETLVALGQAQIEQGNYRG